MIFQRSAIAASMLALMAGTPIAGYEVPFASFEETVGDLDGAAAVAVADLDRDGDLDVIGAALVADVVRIWVNTLPGAWTPVDIRSTFDQAISVAAADINRDGWPDVVVCQRGGDGSVDWLENPDGALTLAWTAHTVTDDLDGGRWIHTADLDGDGDVDVLGARLGASPALRWYENTDGIGGSWTSWNLFDEATFEGPHHVTTADMDNDGDLDAVAAAYTGDAVAWFENDGSIDSDTDWVQHTVGTALEQALAVHAVDLDADGDVDVLAAGFGADEVRVYWNDEGTFTPESLAAGFDLRDPYAVITADLNQDTWLDVVAVGRDSGRVVWWEQSYYGLSEPHQASYAWLDGARSVAPGDFDRDGDLDLVVAAEFDNEVAWIANERIHHRFYNSSYQSSDQVPTIDGLVVGDIDGDGRPNLVVTASNTTADPDILYWTDFNLNDRVVVATGFDYAEDLTLADVNADGRLDVVAVSSGTDTVAWWENTGSGFTQHTISSTADAAIAVDAGDIDADGDVDVVVAAYLDGMLYLYRNAGDGTAWTTTSWSGHPGATAVRLADLDGNGLDDILFGAVGSGEVAWLQQGPPGSYTLRTIDGDFHGTGVSFADVNGDGHLDVLGADSIEDTVSWWANSGSATPSWTRVDLRSGFDGAWDLKGADLDSDGDVDLFGCARESGCLSWWENTDGAGTLVENDGGCWLKALLAVAYDHTRDGLVDLVQLVRGPSWEGIAVRPNHGGQISAQRTGLGPSLLAPGASAAVLSFEAAHQGKPWDRTAELKRLILRWDAYGGSGLDNSEVNSLFSLLSVYMESDGEPGWDPVTDTLVAALYPIPVDYDRYTEITLASGWPNPEIPPGVPVVYHIVLQHRVDARDQPVQTWRMEMETYERDHGYAFAYHNFDSPLFAGPGFLLITGWVTVTPDGLLFYDAFESGDTSAWSSAVGG